MTSMPPEFFVQTRRCKALLGFMTESEALNFLANRCAFPGDATSQRQVWTDARQRLAATGAIPARAPTVQPLPDEIAAAAQALLTSPEGLTLFPAGLCSASLVGVEGLLTYQYYVDTDYVDEIAADVPKPGDWKSVFEFCTRRTPLAEPFIDPAGVTFSSHYAGNSVPEPPLHVRRVDDERYEVVLTVKARPNYVYVLRYPEGRMVINNGNHRVAALVRAGHTEVPAVVQQVIGSIHQMGIGVEGNFNENALLNPVRAPLVTDYLNPAAATDLKLRALNSVLRVGFQAQAFFAPR